MEIDHYSHLGDIAISGDLNSRIGDRQEAHYNINTDGHAYQIAEVSAIPPRRSHDPHINGHSRKLLQLMTNYDMVVTNGRVCGYLSGNYTCFQRKGSPVVDMFIAQKQIFPMINYFKFGKFDWFSNHTPVTVSLAVSLLDKNAVRLNWQSVTKVFHNWYVTNRSHFKDLQYSDTYQARLDEFTQTNFCYSETAATAFTNILRHLLTYYKLLSIKFSHDAGNVVANTNLDHHPDLFDHECQIAKRLWKKAKRSFNKDTDCWNRRSRYLAEKRNHKQGKSEGFDSCDLPSNLTQTGFKSSIFQPVWPWYLMDDPKKQ